LAEVKINYSIIEFVKSVFQIEQLPDAIYPEIAFAGRSNVGKSSLINKLVNRNKLVKVSGRPGKTQSLNFFDVNASLYLVDLPGYGFARVSKKLQDEWLGLITNYLEIRETLRCVVVVIDLRHPLKTLDRELVDWLRLKGIPFLPVYTKRDKLSRNQQQKQAALLDAALGLAPTDRVLFSAKSGEGKEDLITALAGFLC
jgi:GTP-binding protein